MFSGKGGVGKTTLSCGFARHWAQTFPEEKILLLSTDPAHSLGDVLQMGVDDTARPLPDLPNLHVRALDAQILLQGFKARYGKVLELLVERGSFIQGEDLSPVWDLSWPGLDELMGILEIQRLLRERVADRVVVDMAPSGHTLKLFGLMDFLDSFLGALDLFQEKHRVISQTFGGRYTPDNADQFLEMMKAELAAGRQLLQDREQTACLLVAIAELMSLLESKRFLETLPKLQIPFGGLWVNQLERGKRGQGTGEREEGRGKRENFAGTSYGEVEQRELLEKFQMLAEQQPVFAVPQQEKEPVGAAALDHLMTQIEMAAGSNAVSRASRERAVPIPVKLLPGFADFLSEERRLLIVGGKGGVGKTTVAAAIAWAMAQRHVDRKIRVISIDPAHSLGDVFGTPLSHRPTLLADNLSSQEVDANQVLDQFREDYLWELAEMMSGETSQDDGLNIAYGPDAWRQIVAQALPGIDEMLSLVTVMELLENKEQDLIILDTAPTGHLLRFLEMPEAMSDWLAWIFKLWLKYQNVVGRTEFMGRLRTLRQRVMQAQKKLKDPNHTEFIGVLLAQSAVVAEAARLTQSLTQMGLNQRYVVQNRYQSAQELSTDAFRNQIIVRLPLLPRAIAPLEQVKIAGQLLF
jgi:arsenite-transporting ATPase